MRKTVEQNYYYLLGKLPVMTLDSKIQYIDYFAVISAIPTENTDKGCGKGGVGGVGGVGTLLGWHFRHRICSTILILVHFKLKLVSYN